MVAQKVFLLDKNAVHGEQFSSLKPIIIKSVLGLQASLSLATKNSLWISYDKGLTEALLRCQSASQSSRRLGDALLVHGMNPQTLAAISHYFWQFAFSDSKSFLKPSELVAVLKAENRADLIIAGSVDQASKTITFWRGNLESVTVPFTAFETSGDGTVPNFQKFSVTDFGQTVRLGVYEAATRAILVEQNPALRGRAGSKHKPTQHKKVSRPKKKSSIVFGAATR